MIFIKQYNIDIYRLVLFKLSNLCLRIQFVFQILSVKNKRRLIGT